MTPLVGSCQHSPAREVHSSELPETGKEAVNIERIEPQGDYAIRILFGERGDRAVSESARFFFLLRQAHPD